MSTNDKPLFITSLWRNLKRSFISSPNIHIEPSLCSECETTPVTINTNNVSNKNGEERTIVSEHNVKRPRFDLSVHQEDIPTENSFMEIMKNLLSCSICRDVNNYSNQCSNGHLICITCSGKLQQSNDDLTCPVCRVSLKQGLHRSLLAEQLTSELPAACKHCEIVMPVKRVKKHETNECPKRMVPCQYKLFGCAWIGVEENRHQHVDVCPIAEHTVGELLGIVKENLSKDFNQLQIPLQLCKSIMSKIRVQAVGSRMLIRQTTMNRSGRDDESQLIFKSPMIRVPFSCCSLHGFYLDVFVSESSDIAGEKLHYVLKSENRTKISLNYFVVGIKVDENINLDVHDSLHFHQFESNHKESASHELKLLSLDCDKELPQIADFENIFVELCLISERERSERSHGIMNSNDEEETNRSDSNVVFTLFSPSASSSRSVNTSNTTLANSDDYNNTHEVEPYHDDDIVITVTENVDSGDEVLAENREQYTSQNNHSYLAVPSLFLNPSTAAFVYHPYQVETPYHVPNQQMISEQDQQIINLNRIIRPTDSISGQVNMPVQLSLFYPTQTLISPYISSVVPTSAALSSDARRNSVLSQHNLNQMNIGIQRSDVGQIVPEFNSLSNEHVLDQIDVGSNDPNQQSNPCNGQGNHIRYSQLSSGTGSIEDLTLQGDFVDEQ